MYLEKRFGYGARLAASFASWIQLLLYSGVVLYAPALALEATTGLSRVLSIVVVGLVCSFYSTIGGIKAVLITDVFQAILMFVSMFIVIGTAAYKINGIAEIWQIASDGGRIEFDNISLDPTIRHTWWGLIIGGLFTFLSLYAVNQVQVQRMMTLRNLKSARSALWLNLPILTVLSVTTCFSGLALYSHYRNCDPIRSGRISSPDMLLPLYVMDELSNFPGIPGLFIAGIFSAGLSTISAGLNSLAAVTLEDFIKPIYIKYTGNEFPETKSIILSKLLVLSFGITCLALAFAAQLLGGVLQASLTIFGVIGGPLLGIFTLGMLFESTNQIGAITGIISSTAIMLWIAFGQPKPRSQPLPVSVEGCNTTFSMYSSLNSSLSAKESVILPSNDSSYFYLYRISYIWYSAIGFMITIIIGIVTSYISRLLYNNHNDRLDPDLFFPIVAKFIRQRRQCQTEMNGNLMTQGLYVFKSKYKHSEKEKEQNSHL
ncbi:PREDICTED: putative sodium-dependent multivitamin transporter isoform X2 [Ceratosolen solmsi marchali]|uniref:Sodium-dependent multivitamin transporter isoform X2 n=1 Tax=Ceratosolen solmsi marchali TaxID=326594 RepID=A0AAJ7DYP7_9HYME|nr:PREDICTED: putative sodium-dependent multivitamin transporter isoform X2 [Ceratosolen solmsi marchali]